MSSTSSWIEVKDKLPPNNCYVLIALCHENKILRTHFVHIGFRINECWYTGDNDDMIKGKKEFVTHWMPLPDVPGTQVQNKDDDLIIKRHFLDFVRQTHLDIKNIRERLDNIEGNKK